MLCSRLMSSSIVCRVSASLSSVEPSSLPGAMPCMTVPHLSWNCCDQVPSGVIFPPSWHLRVTGLASEHVQTIGRCGTKMAPYDLAGHPRSSASLRAAQHAPLPPSARPPEPPPHPHQVEPCQGAPSQKPHQPPPGPPK